MDKQAIKLPVFVGHVFKKEQFDDLREALDTGFAEVNFIQLVYSDTARFQGALFPKIASLIESSVFFPTKYKDTNTKTKIDIDAYLMAFLLIYPPT